MSGLDSTTVTDSIDEAPSEKPKLGVSESIDWNEISLIPIPFPPCSGAWRSAHLEE